MSFLQAFSDATVQKFVMPFALGLLTIVLGWAVNQLPPLQNANQGWRVLKLAVETTIALVVMAIAPEAVQVVSSPAESAQVVGIASYGVVVLLLDGVDEVQQKYREGCAAAIHQFQREHGAIKIVVCSRIADYELLSTRLSNFRQAIYVLPLDRPQVDGYLQQAGPALASVRTALQQDQTLYGLASQPLFLSILALAYHPPWPNQSPEELLHLPTSARLTRLFDRYIQRMFEQCPLAPAQQEQMICWLGLVAEQMGNEKEFLIEHLQPGDWLRRSSHRWHYRVIFGLIYGLILGLIFALICGLTWDLIYGLILGLILGLLYGLDPILFVFLWGGGQACIQHFVLRLVLYRAGQIPWNFVSFFQQTEERLLIQRTGGSYIFIHRYLQEHFAAIRNRGA
jgi:hypothetical protein